MDSVHLAHTFDSQMDVPEYDPNFEPQERTRSYTWPSRPREIVKEEENTSPKPSSDAGDGVVEATASKESLGLKTKTSSRRNAWGNLSYADLITKAIDSSPEKRLTLSQIYDWMVQNVPYFKDKGDTNSSAGWKNSIRHNLSLHSRFMRIQNEGTGKSSWWVLNPDAKPGKTPRRRATSMDTKTYEKKRGRVKKKLEQLRALGVEQSPKAGSDYGDGDYGSLDPFSLSPQDFRARTSSNASSLGGRLSPIQSLYEADMHDTQVPSMSPLPWSKATSFTKSEGGVPETLSESLAEMFVGESLSSQGTPAGGEPQQLSPSYLPAPPPYSDLHTPQQVSPNSSTNPSLSSLTPISSADVCLQDRYINQTLTQLLQDSPPSSVQASPRPASTSPYNKQYNNGDIMMGNSMPQQQPMLRDALTEKRELAKSQLQAMLRDQQQRQVLQARLKQLRQQHLMRQQQERQSQQLKQQHLLQMLQQQQQQQSSIQSGLGPQPSGGPTVQQHLMAGGMVQQASSPYPDLNMDQACSMPRDLDLVTISEGTSEDLQCDVDQIISHELSMDGLLDFNFDGSIGGNGAVQT